jgi:phosphoglycolate phosphatase-like HAD superfamily hydrolase
VQNPKIILFDLDGTLVDNLNVVVDVYYNFLVDSKLPLKSREFIATLAGKSTFDTGRSMGVPENMLSSVDQYFWDYFGKFVQELENSPNIFPGVPKHALYQMGFDLDIIDRQRIWFIGDTKYDVQAAKSAKITSIAIPQDHTKNGVLASSPDLITDSMESLYDYYIQHFPEI